MQQAACAAACLVASMGLVQAAELAPADLSYDEAGHLQAPLTDMPGDPANGRKVMATKSQGNCISCHAISEMADVPFHGEVGPLLDGVASRYDEAMIRGIVTHSKGVFEGTVMPSYYKVDGFIRPGEGFTGKPKDGPVDPLLTAQQVEDVVAYLMTLTD